MVVVLAAVFAASVGEFDTNWLETSRGGVGEAGRADVCVTVKQARSGSLYYGFSKSWCLGNYFSAKITVHMVRLFCFFFAHVVVHFPSAKLVLQVIRVSTYPLGNCRS